MPIANPLVDISAIPERPLAFTCPATIFVDRQCIIDDLYRLAMLTRKRTTQNMALIGPRRIGKSSIIERPYNHMWNGRVERTEFVRRSSATRDQMRAAKWI